MNSNVSVTIREASPEDMHAVLSLIKELALYENAPHEVTNSVQQLIEDGFGEDPIFECLVAEKENSVIGFALFYISYSTWKGKCLYLEDLYVQEQFRRLGVGKLLFDKVLEIATARNLKRMSWQVLAWNKPALDFYKKYKAELDDEWINGKIRLSD
jgi:GNAT superfamily N-acetyltransferase